MSLFETVIEGTIQADGSLVLDQKPNLPTGRVTVVIRRESETTRSQAVGEDFFRSMEGIWARQKTRGHVSRPVDEIDADRREMRSQVDDEIEAAGRLQEECRRRLKVELSASSGTCRTELLPNRRIT